MTYLVNHQIFSSKDLHEMRDLLTSLTSTDEIDVIGKGADVNASLCLASFGGMNLFHVNYGDVQTRIHTYAHDEDTLLLFALTGGSARINHGGEEFDITPEVGFIRNIRMPMTSMQNAFESFAIPLPVEQLKRHARMLLGDEVPLGDVAFDTTFDLTTPGGQHLRSTIAYIAETMNGPLRSMENAAMLESLRDLLLTCILTSLPNAYTDLLRFGSKGSVALPYHVKRARDYIHENTGRAISLEQLAQHAECGYRTLQIRFNEVYGMSPMAYARYVRLSLAHEDMRMADGDANVRDVASKWGFSHMGAFTRAYRKQFGVLPSRTRRTRG